MNEQGQKELTETVRKEAILRIKNSLVIDKIANVEKIKLEPSDLEAKIKELETVYNIGRTELMQQLSKNADIFNSLSQKALNEKVADFLASNNTVEFVAKKAKK